MSTNALPAPLVPNVHRGSAMPVDKAYKRLADEVGQGHLIRRPLYEELEKQLGGDKAVVAYFTSFYSGGAIDDGDADMLEEVLQNFDLDGKELVLLVNSPGGDGLAAERIVNVCRSYSPRGFSVIVPKMAKSAATMICLGANKICMSKTSELGPIDPQIPTFGDQGQFVGYRAAHEIIESYKQLVKQANSTKGRPDPFLQQLARFDARDIQRIISAQQLSENIAIKCLKTGMLSRLPVSTIRVKIKPFLDPKYTKSHGRPIYFDVAQDSGLNVELHEQKGPLWQAVWALYVRLNYLVTANVSRAIESTEQIYTAAKVK